MPSRLPAGRRRYNMRSFRFKASLLLTALVTGMSGCGSGVHPETISMAKATWKGKPGKVVTITQSGGTKDLEGAHTVSFEFCGWRSGSGFVAPTWMPADFTVAVMKLEPQAVSLFFFSDYGDTYIIEPLQGEF